MKLYAKSELNYTNGLLTTKDGDVVAIDNEIVDLANTLEERLQRAMYLDEQPEFCPGPDLTNFKRKSEFKDYSIETPTPLHDMEAKKTMALMDEIDNANAGEKINDDLAGMKPLLEFADSDSALACEAGNPHRFDLPIIGNPLELTVSKIQAALYVIHDYKQVVVMKGTLDDLKKLLNDLAECDGDCDNCEIVEDDDKQE